MLAVTGSQWPYLPIAAHLDDLPLSSHSIHISGEIVKRVLAAGGVVGAAAATVLVLAPAAANAATPARIQGKHVTKVTITKQVNIVGSPNRTGTRTWTFTPQCAKGACKTTVKRPSIESSTVFTEVYVPQSNGSYRYHEVSSGACYRSDGSVLANNAYTTNLTLVITPTKVVNGIATAYKGTMALTHVRKASAPASCANGVQNAVFQTA
jgi:hypothetical protein